MILVGICAHVSNGRRSDNSVLTLGAEEVERKRTELTVAVALHRVTRETERPQSSIQASLGRALARFLNFCDQFFSIDGTDLGHAILRLG